MGTTASLSDEENIIYTPTSTIQDEKEEAGKNGGRRVHPPDRGLHAWLFLAGSFLIEGLALGESILKPFGELALILACSGF